MINGVEDLGQSGKLLAQIVYSHNSNGSAANTSSVSANLQIKKSTSTATTGTWKGFFELESKRIDINYYGSIKNTWVTIATLSDEVQHNDDGTGSFTMAAEINGPSGTSMEDDSLNAYISVSLETIPRKTTIGNHNGIIGTEMNFSFNPASPSFLHTLEYAFGAAKGTIATKTNIQKIPWTAPNSLYEQIPSSPSGVGVITLYTYDADGVFIGSSQASLVLNANESTCCPEATGTNSLVDINEMTKALTGDANIIVSGYSTGQVTFNALVKNYAGVKSLKLNNNDISYTLTQSDTNILVSATVQINKLSSKLVIIDLVDTRDYPLKLEISASDIKNYVPLTINADFKRVTPTGGHVKLVAEGNYYNGSFGSVDNDLTLSWGVKLKGSNEYTTGSTNITPTITNNTYSLDIELDNPLSEEGLFDYLKEYDFILYYKDKIVDTNVTDSITKGQGDLEVYNGAILMGGIVLFYDNENFVQNEDGSFSKI